MKKCINCGKEFESNDGRVKKCRNCRNESYYTPTQEEFDNLYEASMLRVRKQLKKMQRVSIIKISIDYAFKLIVLGLLIGLLVK